MLLIELKWMWLILVTTPKPFSQVAWWQPAVRGFHLSPPAASPKMSGPQGSWEQAQQAQVPVAPCMHHQSQGPQGDHHLQPHRHFHPGLPTWVGPPQVPMHQCHCQCCCQQRGPPSRLRRCHRCPEDIHPGIELDEHRALIWYQFLKPRQPLDITMTGVEWIKKMHVACEDLWGSRMLHTISAARKRTTFWFPNYQHWRMQHPAGPGWARPWTSWPSGSCTFFMLLIIVTSVTRNRYYEK